MTSHRIISFAAELDRRQKQHLRSQRQERILQAVCEWLLLTAACWAGIVMILAWVKRAH